MLNSINTYLVDIMGPAGPLIAMGILGMFFIVVTLPIFLTKKEDPFDRLAGSAVAKNSSTSVSRGANMPQNGAARTEKRSEP